MRPCHRHADALIALLDTVVLDNRERVVTLAAANKLSAIYEAREFVQSGGLMSYGTNFAEWRTVQDDDRSQLGHVPYHGGYVPDLLSGQVQVVFVTMSSCIQYVTGGMLRAQAVTTATRSDALPDIPTLTEFVPGYEASQWYGIGAPKDTPAVVIDKLNKEINAVAADPIIKARLAGFGVDPMSTTSAEFGKSIHAPTGKWGKGIRGAKLKAE